MRCEEDNELERSNLHNCCCCCWVGFKFLSLALALAPSPHIHLFFHFMFSGVFTNELLLLLACLVHFYFSFSLHQAYALEFSLPVYSLMFKKCSALVYAWIHFRKYSRIFLCEFHSIILMLCLNCTVCFMLK
jgi:hypothetical protein